MKQQTLAMAAAHIAQYERYRKTIWRKAILAAMEQIVPWSQLCSVIEPYVPKYGKGRPPVGLQRMSRMYFVLHWFKLVYVSCEDAPQALWQFSSTEKLQYQSRQGRSGRGVRSIRLWQVHVD